MPRRPSNFAPEMAPFVSPFPPGVKFAEADHFAPGFPLRERLDAAAGIFLAFSGRKFQTPQEKRERLAAIKAAAKAKDRKRLDRLLAATGAGLPGVGLAPEVAEVDMVGAPFAEVLAAVKTAQPEADWKRPPVGGDGALRVLVVDLAAIWEEGTGKGPTVTVDPYSEPLTRGGPFIRFAHDVVTRLWKERRTQGKRKPTAAALAKIHERTR
jgi:hypothetical protein